MTDLILHLSERPRACAMCGKEIVFRSATTASAEAPEMIAAPCLDVWIGFVAGDHAPEMIVACSTVCLKSLLSE